VLGLLLALVFGSGSGSARSIDVCYKAVREAYEVAMLEDEEADRE
jgi:hypothetical protein